MSDQIDGDPFWSEVRRRHPDLDIVLLPPEPANPSESGLPSRDPAPFARMQLADADELWASLVGHGMPRPEAMWIPGPTADSVRHSITLTLDDVADTTGIGHLRDAADRLSADDWHVFIPPTGMPRLTADRPGELGDEALLFGYAPLQRRLFLRLTSTGLPLGIRRAQEMTGAAA
ncbi:hypothetical protein QF046_001106 [Microbacterium sp. W4I4]|uniref:hypothetical protein n=1 Tax=Microbacterium sp. W4I4 TaxID=3042295 RepID=UPI00277E7CF8|nr:hypothetical protein [Microbacterium sp. W4I4]MDQ0613465.1 hypothetical protein [Microbacterium sp. W4I4]